MTDPVDTLMIDLRANTQGFAQDVAAMRGSFDGQLLDGFAKAGDVLERGLLSALRKGSLGFEDLKRIAFNVIDQIAAQAIRSLFASAPQGGSGGGGLGGLIGSLLGGGQTGGSGAGSGIGGLVGSILGSISGGGSGGSSGIDGLIGAISGIGSPQPAGGSSGGLGALIGAISGLPGRATGGAVSPERPFIVGERGPELFVPTSSGSIAPTASGAPRDVRVSISVNAPAGAAPDMLARSSRQIARAVRGALLRED